MNPYSALLLLVALLLSGCRTAEKERASAEETLHPAPELQWKTVHLSQQLIVGKHGEVEFYCCMPDDGMMTVQLTGTSIHLFEVGVGKSTLAVTQGGPKHLRVSVQSLLGNVTLDSLRDAEQKQPELFELAMPIAVRSERREPASTTLRASFNPANAIAAAAARAGSEPFVFDGEQPGSNADAALALWDAPYFSVHRRETAQTLADVDWVALPKWQKTGQKRSCGYKGRTLEFDLEQVDLEVYDRRTAQKVSHKVFPPSGGCPAVVTFTPGEKSVLGPERAPMKAWIDAGIKRGSFP